MPLNMSQASYTPHIRYMASTSSWSMSTENGMQPFQLTEAVFDLENIQTGWALFAEGQTPEWVMHPSLSQFAPKPNDGRDWKGGFKVSVYSKSLFGDQPVREFATSSTGAVKAIEALYLQYEAEAPSNAGKVPVVTFQGSVPLKVGKGNTTVPTLKITKWIDRPADLQGPGVGASIPVQGQAAAISEF